MDGQRSVDDLWKEIAEELGDDAPSQEEVIHLLHQLHAADVLKTGVPPDLEEMNQRRRKAARARWLQSLMNPLAIRVPLWDPDAFLSRTWPRLRRVGVVATALAWTTAVVWALLLAWMHWGELTENLQDRVLAFENLFVLWLTYPVVKFCHELGHAYAVKSGAGEVHEMGLMFLVFAPVPYVDASAASAFRSKPRRVMVGAAGMIVEVFFAATAMFVWVAVEPGLVRAIAFNVMLIGGFSTVVFNGNPLLRFDGYYILSDAIEIPNLAQRSTRYWGYLAKRFALGATEADSPAHTRGERAWFTLYAPISWVYRLFVMLAIALFVMSEYFFIGVLLGLWSIVSMLVIPAGKSLAFVMTNAELDRYRTRANAVTFSMIAGIALLLTLMPVPAWTNVEGVVWVPESAELRAGTGGFVERVLVNSGPAVASGDPVIELSDPELLAQVATHAARVDQLTVQLSSELFSDRVKADLTRQQLEAEKITLQRLENRLDELVVRAQRNGHWMVPNAPDLPGKYFAQGSLLGYVLSGSSRVLRVVVSQEDVDIVRARTREIHVKLADRPQQTYRARLVREIPGGSESLPSKALTLEGGGPHATDPRDPNGLKTLARTFQFDLELSENLRDLRFGTRAHVKFEHEPEPLMAQIYRRVRQLFLGQLSV